MSDKLTTLRELTAADPSDPLGWFMLGTTLVQASSNPSHSQPLLSEAIAALQRVITLNPTHTAAHRWLGDALRKSGNAPAARAAYEQAITTAEQTGDLQVAKECRALLSKLK